MKPKTILMSVAVLFAAAMCLAADANMGTWKLNEAKSKIPAGATKNHTVVYETAGDMVKITVDGVDAEGKAVHNEWTGNWDGKDYAVTGDPNSDMRSYKQAGTGALTFKGTKAGKVTVTGRVVVSADGKTRTVTTTSTDSKGKKTHATGVYDKQ